MIYLLVWLLFTGWAGYAYGVWVGVFVFLLFLLIPPILIARTLMYMDKHKIDFYHLNLVIISFDLVRKERQ